MAGASDRPRDNLSIRRFAVASAIVIGSLSVTLAVALVWSSSALQDALGIVNRDVRSLAIADDLNLSMLTYQRVSNLFVSTREPTLDVVRSDVGMEMDRLLEEAVEYGGGAAEVALIATISEQLRDYRAERARLEARGLEMEEIVGATRVPFEGVLSHMDDLRSMNEVQVERANLTALRINRFSNMLGLAAALLLLTALLLMIWGVQRHVLRPIHDLQRNVERLRHGDAGARSAAGGPSEFAELGRTFNEMADALGHVREGQLAFVAGVAHDLRDPLGSLKLGIHALGHLPPSERRVRALRTLDEQVDRLSRMVADLLDASRIEAGRLELQPEELDLHETAAHVVQMYAPTTRKHELVLAPSPGPATIRADPLRVQQVIGNLVSNAIKFSPDGGSIDVRVEVHDGEAAVSVTDRGIGVDPSEIDSLFLPFRRHRPDVATGAGLGLSVVQRIVEAHGGRIEVVGETGKGATFRVRFPA